MFCIKCEAHGFLGQCLPTHLARPTVSPPWWCLQALEWKGPSPRFWLCLRLLIGFVADVRVLRFLQDVLGKTEGMYASLSIKKIVTSKQSMEIMTVPSFSLILVISFTIWYVVSLLTHFEFGLSFRCNCVWGIKKHILIFQKVNKSRHAVTRHNRWRYNRDVLSCIVLVGKMISQL